MNPASCCSPSGIGGRRPRASVLSQCQTSPRQTASRSGAVRRPSKPERTRVFTPPALPAVPRFRADRRARAAGRSPGSRPSSNPTPPAYLPHHRPSWSTTPKRQPSCFGNRYLPRRLCAGFANPYDFLSASAMSFAGARAGQGRDAARAWERENSAYALFEGYPGADPKTAPVIAIQHRRLHYRARAHGSARLLPRHKQPASSRSEGCRRRGDGSSFAGPKRHAGLSAGNAPGARLEPPAKMAGTDNRRQSSRSMAKGFLTIPRACPSASPRSPAEMISLAPRRGVRAERLWPDFGNHGPWVALARREGAASSSCW